VRAIVSGLLLVASVAGVGYLALALTRTLAFARRRREGTVSRQFEPAVTVLKPLHGDEPELFENLCSFCEQDYPQYQVIFGVRDQTDPAAAVARRVIARFPKLDLSLCIDTLQRGANQKIATVSAMMNRAKHDIMVVADSDVRVGSDYLRAVVAPFCDRSVGAVTCLYRGEPAAKQSGTVIAQLGAMFINEQFAPSVLVAAALAPMDFCLGATMAISRSALMEIGGFDAIASHLADDRMLGKLVSDHGMTVQLSSYVVATLVCERDFRSLWDHELRWARTIQSAQPLGYGFSFITYGLPLCLAYYGLFGSPAGATLCAAALTLRFALHVAAHAALGARAKQNPALIALRDLMGLMIWGASFFGKRVAWRDQTLLIDRQGRLSA
jgi:ceramide glucosyltransferase